MRTGVKDFGADLTGQFCTRSNERDNLVREELGRPPKDTYPAQIVAIFRQMEVGISN